MTDTHNLNHRAILSRIACRAMLERGLLPEFSPAAIAEIPRLDVPSPDQSDSSAEMRDLRALLWSSIDNEDSRDLDQISVAEALPEGKIRVLVGVADVSTTIRDGCAIDGHARANTTSVYTAAEIFPMLPEEVSTGLTSLNQDEDRPALVVEMIVEADGSLDGSSVYRAWVRNKAKLAYPGVAAWLEGEAEMPAAVAAVEGLAENLRMQDRAARDMKKYRQRNGALSLETISSRPVFKDDEVSELKKDEKNRARELVENLMITANGITARYLAGKKFPSIRRMVRAPKRWERIAAIAAEHGHSLPAEPDSRALEAFLQAQKAADPLRFPDLSLSVIKLLGGGEYVAEHPDGDMPGHFGLAVKDYGHSTAPNRRYTDLLTQRLIFAALEGKPAPYSLQELDELAKHCTQAEDAANKVERQVGKSAAALLLSARIGERFEALVTGAAQKGTWVRLIDPPVEGRVVEGYEGMDVGERVRVTLVALDV